jgi:restriction endonuclease S subunit
MRGANIKRGYFDFSQDLNKYWESSEGLEKYLLKANDIIISMDGSLVGKSFCYLKKEHLPLLLVQRVARIRTKENFKFLYYVITKEFPFYVEKKKTAGAIPHISMKDINSFPVPLPSKIEQQRIVSILDTFEASISNLEAQLAQRQKQYEYYRNQLLTFE